MAARKSTKPRRRPARRAAKKRPRSLASAKKSRKQLKKKVVTRRKAARPKSRATSVTKHAARKKARAAKPPRRAASKRRATPKKARVKKAAARPKRAATKARARATEAKKAPRRAKSPKKATVPVRQPKSSPAIPELAGLATRPKGRRPTAPPDLGRQRRTLPDEERLEQHEPAAIGPTDDERHLLTARTGFEDLRHRLSLHTETSPEITAGDVDARWEDAYSTGDEAPGGDNPTPDQDRVDDIGKALGISYAEDEELRGGEEITDRDRHRWEYDPASSEDWPHNRRGE